MFIKYFFDNNTISIFFYFMFCKFCGNIYYITVIYVLLYIMMYNVV